MVKLVKINQIKPNLNLDLNWNPNSLAWLKKTKQKTHREKDS